MKFILFILIATGMSAAQADISRCHNTISKIITPLATEKYKVPQHTLIKMQKDGLSQADLDRLMNNKLSMPVRESLHAQDHSHYWFLATLDGKDYANQRIFKIVAQKDPRTGIFTVLRVTRNTNSAEQTKYFALVAKHLDIRDYLDASFNPIMGIQSVLFPDYVVVKMAAKHGVFPNEVMEAFNIFDSQSKIEHQKSSEKRSVRHILYSMTAAGRLLKIVFVIENNQIVVLSAYAEARTLH